MRCRSGRLCLVGAAAKAGLQQAGVNIAYELIQRLVPVETGTE